MLRPVAGQSSGTQGQLCPTVYCSWAVAHSPSTPASTPAFTFPAQLTAYGRRIGPSLASEGLARAS